MRHPGGILALQVRDSKAAVGFVAERSGAIILLLLVIVFYFPCLFISNSGRFDSSGPEEGYQKKPVFVSFF